MRKLIAVLALAMGCAHGATKPGVWAMSSSISPLTDDAMVMLELGADAPAGTKPPTLMLRCQDTVIDVYVMGVAATATDIPVTLRMGQTTKQLTWESSSTRESIFYPGGLEANVAFIRELAGADTLAMDLVGASPATMTFTVAGLTQHLPAFQKACLASAK